MKQNYYSNIRGDRTKQSGTKPGGEKKENEEEKERKKKKQVSTHTIKELTNESGLQRNGSRCSIIIPNTAERP